MSSTFLINFCHEKNQIMIIKLRKGQFAQKQFRK